MKIRDLSLTGHAILAPMAGITQWPLRLLCKQQGAAMVFSEMVSAEGLVRRTGKARLFTLQQLRSRPEERPLGIQLFGKDPVSMAEAAKMVADLDADLIDINMGCPVPKVVRNGAGSALMQDPDLIARIIEAVRPVTDIPFTIKLRSGWDSDSINAPEIAKLAQGLGVDAVIVHARTRSQGFSGSADWSVIKRVVDTVSIPVIGNGDVRTYDDAERMMATTGCSAVMVGRAAMGNPWVFAQVNDPDVGLPSLADRREVILKHYKWMEEHLGARTAAIQMRKHICWYVRNLPNATELRRKINHAAEFPDALGIVSEYFEYLEKWQAETEDPLIDE